MMRGLSNSSPQSGDPGPSLPRAGLTCDHVKTDRLHRIVEKFRPRGHRTPTPLLIVALLAGACGAASGPEAEVAVPLPAADESQQQCSVNGRLSTRLYGAIDGDISWASADMACEGMPRPNEAGARLRFSGPHPSGDGTLVFIAAIPTLTPELAASELATRLTIIDENQSRFFASPDFDICWTDIEANEPAGDARHVVSGRIYCIAPINEVNGSATVTAADILFSGRIDWDAS